MRILIRASVLLDRVPTKHYLHTLSPAKWDPVDRQALGLLDPVRLPSLSSGDSVISSVHAACAVAGCYKIALEVQQAHSDPARWAHLLLNHDA
ncbi:hypothetical protein V2J09_023074 [Rumex salicifolius]